MRYSGTEDFAETKDVIVSNYVNDIVLDKRQSLRKQGKTQKVNNPIYANRSFCAFYEGGGSGLFGRRLFSRQRHRGNDGGFRLISRRKEIVERLVSFFPVRMFCCTHVGVG